MKCSPYGYREDLVCECHNKKTDISEKEIEKLIEKNKLSKEHMDIISALGKLVYAGHNHISRYITVRNGNEDDGLMKKMNQLCDYGIVLVVSFYTSDNLEKYRTCNIYSLSRGGMYILRNVLKEECSLHTYQSKICIEDENDIRNILNRLAFNSFYVGSFTDKIKYYLSYNAGKTMIEGRMVILSNLYFEGMVNICVMPVRDTVDGCAACTSKIRAALDHFSQKRIKKPWFILICEEDAHEIKLYNYLKECKMTEEAVICMTKDTYLIQCNVDAFDNITTFSRNGEELVSEYKRLLF